MRVVLFSYLYRPIFVLCSMRYSPLYNGRVAAFVLIVLLGGLVYSCANMSRPGGGPRDTEPPRYLRSKPLPDAVNVTDNRIEIDFDEIIQVENPSEKIIVSPPQIEAPKIQAQGKKLRIELLDSLRPNTTYTIDFGDAIVDNNEKNALSGYAFSFSTGDSRDSLQISGLLLNAEDLEPITGMLVGVYSNLDDTAFTTLPMERIASSDALGHFTIRNLKPGRYRVVALKDMNRDYHFDNPSEDIAFLDTIVEPYAVRKQYVDSVWVDSLTLDTVITYDYNRFYPDNILLTAFNEGFKSRYMESYERKERKRLDVIFSAPHDSLPTLEPLNFTPSASWYLLESNPTNDTLAYWLPDSAVYNLDTLHIAMTYYRTDSLNELSLYNDTLQYIYRPPKTQKKKNRRAKNDTLPEVEPTVFMQMTVGIAPKQDVNKPFMIEFATPVASLERAAFHLAEKIDTLWVPLPDTTYTLIQDTANIRRYYFGHKWKPEGAYRFSIDSMAVIDIYGLHTDKYSKDFAVKSMQEYSNLYFAITGVTDSAVVQLLNNSDKVVVEAAVKEGGAEFTYLKPGTYYARLFIDRNGNGKYDTGNYAAKLQPEEVYYYPSAVELKAYWNVEQVWNIYEKAIDLQKPYAIKKNKPKDQKPPEEEEDDEDEYYNNMYDNNNYYNNGTTAPSNFTGTPYGSY